MSELSVWLAKNGLTGGQTVGFIITSGIAVCAAFVATRENRRQYKAKTQTERLTAAGELVVTLNRFERDLHEIIYNNTNCNGMTEGFFTDFQSAEIQGEPHKLAAILGDKILARLIRLEGQRAEAHRSASRLFDVVGGEEAIEETTTRAATLALETVSLINAIYKVAGIDSVASPTMSQNRLLELSDNAQ